MENKEYSSDKKMSKDEIEKNKRDIKEAESLEATIDRAIDLLEKNSKPTI